MSRQAERTSRLTALGAELSITPRMAAVLGALLLAVLCVLAYWPSMGSKYIIDDDLYLTNSPFIKSADGLRLFWFSMEPIDYYPVSNTTLWIEWRLWGMNPWGYHATNVLLHLASAILVWSVLKKLAVPGAFLAALLFAVHPVNVESVAWISQRKDLLAVVFFLISVFWYLKSDELPATIGEGLRDELPRPPANFREISGIGSAWLPSYWRCSAKAPRQFCRSRYWY